MGIGLLHDPEYKEQNVDVEAGVYLKQPAEVQPPLRCYQLSAVTVASVVHHGAFNRIGEAYTDLLRWVSTFVARPVVPRGSRPMYLSKSSENPSGQTARWKVTNILRCCALPTLWTVPINWCLEASRAADGRASSNPSLA